MEKIDYLHVIEIAKTLNREISKRLVKCHEIILRNQFQI